MSQSTPGNRYSAYEFIKTIAFFLITAVMIKGTVVEAFQIPTTSMQPTLLIGDYLLVNKLNYGLRMPFAANTVLQFREPSREDIVVFARIDDPSTEGTDESAKNYIKRVIGLPGDVVEVRGTDVLINSKVYEEDKKYSRWVFGGVKNFGPETVPPGKVFLMGDNRDQSLDARDWNNDHFLDIRRIKGKAFIIYFPLHRMFKLVH